MADIIGKVFNVSAFSLSRETIASPPDQNYSEHGDWTNSEGKYVKCSGEVDSAGNAEQDPEGRNSSRGDAVCLCAPALVPKDGKEFWVQKCSFLAPGSRGRAHSGQTSCVTRGPGGLLRGRSHRWPPEPGGTGNRAERRRVKVSGDPTSSGTSCPALRECLEVTPL